MRLLSLSLTHTHTHIMKNTLHDAYSWTTSLSFTHTHREPLTRTNDLRPTTTLTYRQARSLTQPASKEGRRSNQQCLSFTIGHKCSSDPCTHRSESYTSTRPLPKDGLCTFPQWLMSQCNSREKKKPAFFQRVFCAKQMRVHRWIRWTEIVMIFILASTLHAM